MVFSRPLSLLSHPLLRFSLAFQQYFHSFPSSSGGKSIFPTIFLSLSLSSHPPLQATHSITWRLTVGDYEEMFMLARIPGTVSFFFLFILLYFLLPCFLFFLFFFFSPSPIHTQFYFVSRFGACVYIYNCMIRLLLLLLLPPSLSNKGNVVFVSFVLSSSSSSSSLSNSFQTNQVEQKKLNIIIRFNYTVLSGPRFVFLLCFFLTVTCSMSIARFPDSPCRFRSGQLAICLLFFLFFFHGCLACYVCRCAHAGTPAFMRKKKDYHVALPLSPSLLLLVLLFRAFFCLFFFFLFFEGREVSVMAISCPWILPFQ